MFCSFQIILSCAGKSISVGPSTAELMFRTQEMLHVMYLTSLSNGFYNLTTPPVEPKQGCIQICLEYIVYNHAYKAPRYFTYCQLLKQCHFFQLNVAQFPSLPTQRWRGTTEVL